MTLARSCLLPNIRPMSLAPFLAAAMVKVHLCDDVGIDVPIFMKDARSLVRYAKSLGSLDLILHGIIKSWY